MSKNVYSLILSDEVVEQIDRLAGRQNISRSALVNAVLADYCSLLTPEQRIASIFRSIAGAMHENDDLAVLLTPNQPTMAFKTSLAYRYRPTVRYDLRLYPQVTDRSIGELTVTFRTQSDALLSLLDDFFRVWAAIETKYAPVPVQYALSAGKLVRSLPLPPNVPEHLSGEVLSEALSSYIRLFDTCMKAAVAAGVLDTQLAQSIETEYRSWYRPYRERP